MSSPQRSPFIFPCALVLASLALANSSATLRAQTSPAPKSDAAAGAASSVVELTAFEVTADPDDSYGALNSNSITGFRVELAKLPLTADILDATLMKDLGPGRDVYELLSQMSAGAGFSPLDAGGNAAVQPLDRVGASTNLRGLSASTVKRDGFVTPAEIGTGQESSFALERIELINGPQSLLYGSSGGGGVVNLVSKAARLNQRAFGEFTFQIDNDGHTMGQVDFGTGGRRLGVRLALVRQDIGTRREDIGGIMQGGYAQLVTKVYNTTFRLSSQAVDYQKQNPTNLVLNARSAAADVRNNQNLSWLIATNQIDASANGAASSSGPLLNGRLNWDNVNSFGGEWNNNFRFSHLSQFVAETKWTDMFSTKASVGYAGMHTLLSRAATTLYAPDAAANPLREWAIGLTGARPGTFDLQRQWGLTIRLTGLLTNSLFNGRARSQTTFGVDKEGRNNTSVNQAYFQADDNFNVITSPTGVRTNIPMLYWSVANGVVRSPFPNWKPFADRVTLNGVNYAVAPTNPINPALVSVLNPVGTTTTTGDYTLTYQSERGAYAANHTEWLDGRLSTLLGARYTEFSSEIRSGTTRTGTVVYGAENVSVNAGVVYQWSNWFAPYIQYSDSFAPPTQRANDPYGEPPGVAHSIGQEAGFKFANGERTLSGSLAFFNVNSKDEQYIVPAATLAAINYDGVNGRFGSAPNTVIAVERKSRGAQLALNANPTRNWRMRLSAAMVEGEIGTTKSYPQLYNDQFYANAQGQVTYRDGSPVYVNPTFSAANPRSTATTAGALPLTIGMLSTPGNVYYANPMPVTGQIDPASPAGIILNSSDPVRGPIGTDAVGLPIDRIQINPGFRPPGAITAAARGEATTGYPKYSLNLTNVYKFDSGLARGVRVGGTVNLGWKNTWFYYDPAGISAVRSRIPFERREVVRFDLIVGYEHRFDRITWSTQFNVYNMFNRYRMTILPDPVAGWGGRLNATFDQQPRSFRWTNSLSF